MSFEMDRIRHLGGSELAWGSMSKQTFTAKVLPMFGLGLLVAAIGVYYGRLLPMNMQWGVVIAELALVFTSGLWQRKEGLNSLLFFLYALCSGITLVPLLTYASMAGGLTLIAQALSVTTVTFGGLGLYGMTTKRDFTSIGGFLFMGALALIAASLLNGFFFHSGMTGVVISVLGVAVFSGFVLYDMAMIRRAYTDADYVGAALGLFINFVGLFTFILRLFVNFGGRDD